MTDWLPESYPSTPPVWIADWPTTSEVDEMFSEGIRRYAFRAARQAGAVHFEWNDDGLVLRIDAQRTEWRRTGNTWQVRCTCGYPDGRCAHGYLAALIFRRICEKENWLFAGGKPAAARGPSDTASHPRRRGPGSARQMDLPLFRSAPPQVHRKPARIEAEADFRHEPGRVTLRFYLNRKDEGRTLLRMQQLWNLACQCADDSPMVTSLAPTSREFLAWIRNRITGHIEIRQNLNVLKLSPEEFRYWLLKWGSRRGLFIERSTQQPIEAPDSGRASVRFEVRVVKKGAVMVQALACFPNGRRRPLPSILAQTMSSGAGAILPDGLMDDENLPLPRDVLWKTFGKGPVRIPAKQVAERLPKVINGRFDLIEGPRVQRHSRRGPLSVHVGAGGDRFIVELRIAGQVLQDPENGVAIGQITVQNGGILVEEYYAPETDAVLQRLFRLPVERDETGWSLPADHESLAALARFWRSLPPEVHRRASPELLAVFTGAAQLKPQLVATQEKSLVSLRVAWAARDGTVTLDAAEMRRALQHGSRYVRGTNGRWFELPEEAAARWTAELSSLGLDPFGVRRLLTPQAREVLARVRPELLEADERTRRLVDRILTQAPEPLCEPPERIARILREYQREGVRFLAERVRYRVGAILADDMGLGKTLQVLALLDAWYSTYGKAPDSPDTAPAGGETAEAEEGPRRGALVICPASVMSVWEDEIRRFFPDSLRAALYRGKPDERRRILEDGDWDVLITNFALVRNDETSFQRYTYDFIVVDEAQNIKNPDALISRAVRRLRTPHPIALTGTPLENRLLDLWSIMQFLNPGYFGRPEDFMEYARGRNGVRRVRERLAPVMLRRTKAEVAPELPPRTEEVLKIEMLPKQAAFYRQVLQEARQSLGGTMMHVFAALTRLRQVCCHPELIGEAAAGSGKLDTLLDMLDEVLAEDHAALVFSQFTSMLDIIGRELDRRGLPHMRITGETPVPRRREIVRDFQEADQPHVLLLSLRAAGAGLNLTRAEYVFLYDPWWNPAVEAQAIDRAHRIGQDRPVFAYRLITRDAVEERVLDLQQSKAELFRNVVDAAAADRMPNLTEEDLRYLLS